MVFVYFPSFFYFQHVLLGIAIRNCNLKMTDSRWFPNVLKLAKVTLDENYFATISARNYF